ncbi:sensor histidine kinase [Natronoglycomyces albus]|uniref:histidine kinase n=1 Tax=Natronoglycomyces albus TaxID=2811108 RepID=A0A895XIV6_9ACTN|nr:sensor histidine kinase [Natronoglycomyces albus]QSB05731.1 sensor histidine kinase [Natronoglycomyces albus]
MSSQQRQRLDTDAGHAPQRRDVALHRRARHGLEQLRVLAAGLGTSLLALITVYAVLLTSVLSLIGVGLLLARPVASLVRHVADLERNRLERWGVRIPRPYAPTVTGEDENPWGVARALLRQSSTRRDLAWLFTHASFGFCVGILGIALPLMAVRDLSLPAWWYLAPAGEASNSLGIPANSWAAVLFFALTSPIWAVLFTLVAPPLSRAQAWAGRRFLPPDPHVDLSQRVAQLTATRAAALDAHVTELRRIERALHDGSQNRLVAVAVLTGAAGRALDRDPTQARDAIERAQQASEEALKELRSVVRSIMPPVLENQGLEGAIYGLTASCPLPCHVDVSPLPRLAMAVEACAYFALAEMLTNVAKHSGATQVRVTVSVKDDRLCVRVADDGQGAADIGAGKGLAGMRDRVAALDGHLRISSPVGGPTVVDVELPCG